MEKKKEQNLKMIGAYEANIHLSELLKRVAKDNKYIITKNGLPLAQLIPMPNKQTEES